LLLLPQLLLFMLLHLLLLLLLLFSCCLAICSCSLLQEQAISIRRRVCISWLLLGESLCRTLNVARWPFCC
jgi:hypothetical protein